MTSLRGLGIGPQFARLLQTWARRRRIAIYATRDDIRVLRRRRLCVDERRQGGDKTPAGLKPIEWLAADGTKIADATKIAELKTPDGDDVFPSATAVALDVAKLFAS